MSDTVKDMLQKNVLTIDPLIYITPYKKGGLKTYTVSSLETGQYSESPFMDVTNIGNDYAHAIIRTPDRTPLSGNTKVLSINSWEQTMACYYR